jgi:hypothetical protein
MANIIDREFGCEIEISTPFEDSKEILKPIIEKEYGERTLQAIQNYYDSTNNYKKWHLKIDTTTEAELCTPISKFNQLKHIKKVVEKARKEGIEITKRDSLHVHVQANDVDPRNVLAAWLLFESTIKDCFPSHRHKNDYSSQLIKCRRKGKNIANFLMRAIIESEDHHCIISFHHYEDRKTIEFRISEGTLSGDHIRNWVKFCLCFVNAAKKIDPVITICKEINSTNIDDLIEWMKIKDKKLQSWLRKRHQEFKI